MRDGSAGEMLPGKHEDLGLIPRTHIKKLGIVAHVFNLGTEEVETSRSIGFFGQPVKLCGKLRVCESPFLR